MAKRWSAGEKVNASDLNNSVVPTGAIMPFAGASAPTDWLLCDGAAVSRATYADLYALISTTYGVGDGSTTFNLPNLKGRVPVGKNASDTEFDVLGETGGEKAHTLVAAEMPARTHPQNGMGGGESQGNSAPGFGNYANLNPSAVTGSTGGDTAHNNLQPYIVLQYIIKS